MCGLVDGLVGTLLSGLVDGLVGRLGGGLIYVLIGGLVGALVFDGKASAFNRGFTIYPLLRCGSTSTKTSLRQDSQHSC